MTAAADLVLERPSTSTHSIVPGVAGFFFVARHCVTFLFFQSNPADGSLVIIAIGLLLTYAAFVAEGHRRLLTQWTKLSATRWLTLYLAFAGVSILWSGAPSKAVGLAYWVGMAADAAITLVLLSDPLGRMQVLNQLLKGAVWGAFTLALIGWISPPLPDLRLGDLVFLHPNTLGLQLGLSALMACYLASYGSGWSSAAIFLAVTLLRTLSKTSIIAFGIAAAWMLLERGDLSRARKLKTLLFASLVLACFSGLFLSYLSIYNTTGSGNQAETLTGRTVLWTTALGLGIQAPWFGHGFYSFRALIPTFGDFEPWHAHNEVIQIFFEFGFVGVVLATMLHWKLFLTARHALGPLRLLTISLIIFSLLHGLTDTVPFGFSLPVWLFVALPLALSDQATPEVAR